MPNLAALRAAVTLAGTGLSHPSTAQGGGGVVTRAFSPLIELKLHGKNERVARHETKRFVYKLKVLGQLVTFEVGSSAENT